MSGDDVRRLAAIMFTDMAGYSSLSQRDDKLALELLEEHRRLLREIFPRFHGAELKTVPGLGPAPRRSALRQNRRFVSAERERREFAEVKSGTFFAELKRRNV
jgi:hypothetical protein